jgi:hypothetical protein
MPCTIPPPSQPAMLPLEGCLHSYPSPSKEAPAAQQQAIACCLVHRGCMRDRVLVGSGAQQLRPARGTVGVARTRNGAHPLALMARGEGDPFIFTSSFISTLYSSCEQALTVVVGCGVSSFISLPVIGAGVDIFVRRSSWAGGGAGVVSFLVIRPWCSVFCFGGG